MNIPLNSLDFVRLIAWLAYFKHNVLLNKTQMQKLLFMCYGQALAMTDEPLFVDDTPKAWPFGPVFPRSYRRYEEHIPSDLSNSDKARFSATPKILKMIAQTVADFCHMSAVRLSDWSHAVNGPWYQTVFTKEGVAWNREIDQNLIKEFFSNQNWKATV